MQNIFKLTYRNFVRKPVINLINLVGLAVSLGLVIILSVYSYSELTTDNYHKNGDRVYLYSDEIRLLSIYSPGKLKDEIDLNIPGVESTVRIVGTGDNASVFQVGDKDPITTDLIFADQDFFKLFTYKVIEGNPELAMKEPMSIVITKTLSEKLFGKESASGKTVKWDNEKEFTIKAVIEEPKANSCLAFSAVTSMAARKIRMTKQNVEVEFGWPWCSFQTFVLLKDGTNPEEMAKSISSLIPKDFFPKTSSAKLIPLKNLYFSQFSLFHGNYLHCGDQKKVMILLIVAAMVFGIALINFNNISASQWMGKIRQTGVLKINGASHSSLIVNVLAEAFLFFIISLVLAYLLVSISVPYICNYTGMKFKQQLIYTPTFLSISIAITLALSILFSLIPAVRISSSKAIDNLNRSVEPQIKIYIVRGILLTAQFSIAIFLIAFTMLVQKQVNLGTNNLGINSENIVAIKLTPELYPKMEVLKNILVEKSMVKNVSFTGYYPGENISYWETKMDGTGEQKQLKYDTFSADAGFFETMGLELVMGRFFSADLSSDANKVVVNESFIRENNLLNPIGVKFLSINFKILEIIGVVKDFHYKPIYKSIIALAIRNEPYASYCMVNLQTSDYSALIETIQEIKNGVANLSPSFPVEIRFLDKAIENLYQSELQFRRTFSLFAGSAIVICCMGILAMSMFACQHRIKEMGIRKVNGAKISEIMVMLNKDFVKWVAIAFVIATPIAYYAMTKWLENFAYKTTLSWWIFALAGTIALGIALLTVSWQSWKAATRNPVEALRYE